MHSQGIGAAWRVAAAGLLAAAFSALVREPPARAYTPEQVQAGAQVFSQICSGCHGARGEGAGPDDPEAPLLVGPLGLTSFRDAQEIFDFIKVEMPSDVPGSLTETQYWNALAWLLAENSIPSPGQALGPATAGGVSLARR